MFVRAGARVVRCAPMGIPQPVRFDTYCDLALTDVPSHGQVTLIRRDQFDEQHDHWVNARRSFFTSEDILALAREFGAI